jgi:MoaA/NifB/PqqE/SkfB family radical SAM enzyme
MTYLPGARRLPVPGREKWNGHRLIPHADAGGFSGSYIVFLKLMMIKFIWRLIRETSPRLLWKFSRNFGWKGVRAVSRFSRRLKNGNFYPAFLFISVTNACNLACKGCWVTRTDPAVELSVTDIHRIIDESKKEGCYFFGILGGEPLLYNKLPDIFEAHPDCYFQLFTNGTLLDDEIAGELNRLGNVTPLISIEGLEKESDIRRGGNGVYQSSISGLETCRRHRLVTGVASSICRTNYNELVHESFVQDMYRRGAHYLWYYIYRPAGADPSHELVLTEEQVNGLRQFIVEQRAKVPMLIVDAYWDHDGRAQCPAATGISHHINPWGDIEPCPVIQFACDSIHDGALKDVFTRSTFLRETRHLMTQTTRGCILMENPQELESFLHTSNARDTSGRGTAREELLRLYPCPSHYLPGQEIPERHPVYRAAKKRWFFGFGAYG